MFFGKIIPKEQSVRTGSISPHSSRSPGIYGTRFMSSITTAMCLIPLKQVNFNFRNRWQWCICDLQIHHTGISIARNIYRLVWKEQRITQFVLPHWIQMHKRRLFTDLLQSWYALATQTKPGAPRCRLRKHGARKEGVSNQRKSSWQPSTRKDCISSAFRWCPPPRESPPR